MKRSPLAVVLAVLVVGCTQPKPKPSVAVATQFAGADPRIFNRSGSISADGFVQPLTSELQTIEISSTVATSMLDGQWVRITERSGGVIETQVSSGKFAWSFMVAPDPKGEYGVSYWKIPFQGATVGPSARLDTLIFKEVHVCDCPASLR